MTWNKFIRSKSYKRLLLVVNSHADDAISLITLYYLIRYDQINPTKILNKSTQEHDMCCYALGISKTEYRSLPEYTSVQPEI